MADGHGHIEQAAGRLIFVNRFFHPDNSASSQLLSDLAFALAESGLSIRVIASRRLYQAGAQLLPAHETIAGVDVHRLPTSDFGRRNLIGRMIDYISFYVLAAWRLWRLAERGDIVIAKTDPPLLSVLTVPIARMRGAYAVNWLQDVYPEVAERLGVGGRIGRLVFAALRWLRDYSLRAAQANVVLGERMAQHLEGLGVGREKIGIIPNWADGRAITPVAPAANSLRRQWGLDDRFVVGYSGNLGRAHDIDTILESIALIDRKQATNAAARERRIAWLFIGGGKQLEALRRRAGAMRSPSVRFEVYQPREKLAESLSVADVHLVSLQPALEGLIVPSKFYGIAAVGRPTVFIGEPDGEIARIIGRTGCGINIRQGEGRQLAEAILGLAGDPERCIAMGAAARHTFEAGYDLLVAVARWQSLLGRIKEPRAVPAADQPEARTAGRAAPPASSRNAR